MGTFAVSATRRSAPNRSFTFARISATAAGSAWRSRDGLGRHARRHDGERRSRRGPAHCHHREQDQFLRGHPQRRHSARGLPLYTGRTTIVLQTNISRSDGKLAAIVTQTQIVLPATEQPPDKSRLRASSPRRTSRGSLERFHIGWKQKHFCTVAFSGGNRIPLPIKPGACFS
jgi:hypothetical protein